MSFLYPLVATGFALLAIVAPYLIGRLIRISFRTGQIRMSPLSSWWSFSYVDRQEAPFTFKLAVFGWIVFAALLEFVLLAVAATTVEEGRNTDCSDLQAHCAVSSAHEVVH